MTVTLALGGDAMLGRGVGAALAADPRRPLVAPEVLEVAREADLFLLNLECAISSRGSHWPNKVFYFRAPPVAADVLAQMGVHCVTLANNHTLDFGFEALLDTFQHLEAAGIRWVGAGVDLASARRPVVLESRGLRVAVLGVVDHGQAFAAAGDRPGTAFADLISGVPEWLPLAITGVDADVRMLCPHWGPNDALEPWPHVRTAAARLAPLATLVAGHSAHLFQGVAQNVLYDLGGFVDDYSPGDARQLAAKARRLIGGPGTRRRLRVVARRVRYRLRRGRKPATARRDLGLLALARVDATGLLGLEAVPLKLEFCRTRLAEGADAAWARRRLIEASRALGTDAAEVGERVVLRVGRERETRAEVAEATRKAPRAPGASDGA